jgi:hypothetical protein
MDFDLSEEQKGIQKAAEEFAKGEFSIMINLLNYSDQLFSKTSLH